MYTYIGIKQLFSLLLTRNGSQKQELKRVSGIKKVELMLANTMFLDERIVSLVSERKCEVLIALNCSIFPPY
jgi:hypothetical protein